MLQEQLDTRLWNPEADSADRQHLVNSFTIKVWISALNPADKITVSSQTQASTCWVAFSDVLPKILLAFLSSS